MSKKSYECTVGSVLDKPIILEAESAGKARHQVVTMAHDAGYRKIGYSNVRVRPLRSRTQSGYWKIPAVS